MTKLEQYRDIAKRLEAATASCNTIDVSIADALGITLDKEYNDNVGEDWYIISGGWPDRLYCWLPYFTNSIDAAIGLAERVLPLDKVWAKDSPPSSGWRIFLYRGLTVDQWECCLRPHGVDGQMFDAPTAPLAILRALFAALIQQEESK